MVEMYGVCSLDSWVVGDWVGERGVEFEDVCIFVRILYLMI